MLAGPLLFGPPPKQLIQTLDNPTISTYIEILIFPLNFSYLGCMTKVLSTCRIGNTLGTHCERALEPLRTWWEQFGKSCERLGDKTIPKIPSYPPLSKREEKKSQTSCMHACLTLLAPDNFPFLVHLWPFLAEHAPRESSLGGMYSVFTKG
jgi:hypothetical protein